MKRTSVAAAVAVLALGAGAVFARADVVKGSFHFGNVRFTPTDAIALRVEAKEPGKIATMVALTDFKIDRRAVTEAIDAGSALIGQIAAQQSGNVVFLDLGTAGQCGVSALLGGYHSVGLGDGFNAITRTASATRISGECATLKPGKMFDDAYDFSLVYDIPITAIAPPTALPAGGGEPGAAYLALVKAIQARDFAVAQRHLPADQVPATPPREAAEVENYFHGLALNYPKRATVVGGLVKGGQARIEIEGVHYEGKKVKGPVSLRKAAGTWQVVEQQFHFAE